MKAGERGPGARVGREDDRLFEPVEPLDDPGQPLWPDVRLPVDGDEDVAAGLDAEPGEHVRAFACDRPEQPVRIGHHVADHERPPGDALALELQRRALVGAEEERRAPVDLDAVALLGHRHVEAPQPGLDVRERRRPRRLGSGESRVRVAEHDDPVRPLVRDRGPDPGDHRARLRVADVQLVPGLVEPELLEEDVRELPVVVLPGVHDDLVDPGVAERRRERRRLDELGPVAHDGDDAHGARLDAAPGPLAQLVEQGTLNPKVEGSNPSRPTSRRRSGRVLALAELIIWRRGFDI